MARFHPPLVLTRAQPSITRQLRAVQGSTGTRAMAQTATIRAAVRAHLDERVEDKERGRRAGPGDSKREERDAEERLRPDERRDPEDEAASATPRSGFESRTASQNAASVRSAASGSVITSAA